MKTGTTVAFAVLGILATAVLTASFFGTSTSATDAGASSQSDQWNTKIRTISVTGISDAKVTPDRVSISFAVESQEKTARQAAEFNSKVTSLVIDALKTTGLAESEISTSYYNVYPIYEYAETPVDCIQYDQDGVVQKYCPPPSLKQILVGYVAVNSIVVESAQLDRAGAWIDAAVGAGANRVESLYFYVSTERQDEIRNNLTAEAVDNARLKASIALQPLGMEIVDVQSISLDSYPIIYAKRGYEYAAGSSAPSTPIMVGAQDVTVTVHATFEIGGSMGTWKLANATIQTLANKEFEIILTSNPSTGYQWQVKSIDPAIVRLKNDEFVPPESNLMGSAGKQVFTFEARGKGNAMIVLEYVRPWEPGKPVSIYTAKVTVLAAT